MRADFSIPLKAGWSLLDPEDPEFEAVPADAYRSVQSHLIDAGHLHDVHDPRGDRDYEWVSRRAWTLRHELEYPESAAKFSEVELVFQTVDTLAEIWLGDEPLGRCDNAHRPWRFPIGEAWEGTRTLEVRFQPLFEHLDAKRTERPLPGWGVGQDKDDTGGWVRKAPVDFGWDFAPKVVPVGLRGGARIELHQETRLRDVQVLQVHEQDAVLLDLWIEYETEEPHDLEVLVSVVAPYPPEVLRDSAQEPSTGAPLSIEQSLQIWVKSEPAVDGLELPGRPIPKRVRHTTSAVTRGGIANVQLRIPEPRLWWPNGLGAQPLYDLSVFLDGDTYRCRLGLRRLELVRERDGAEESFGFRINGRPMFAFGANWVPPTALPGEEPELTDDLLVMAHVSGMNMLRVWGGSGYETDAFYDRCDELGLLVWTDFAFACCTYPTFDADWMASVEAEARHQVKRLRHHAALALWCGNNEVENGLTGPEWTNERMSWDAYRPLFDELLAKVCSELDPATGYWPGSPHSPLGDRMAFNSEANGDAHLWAQWHGAEPFEKYLEGRHRFVSETGWQSLPHIETLREVFGSYTELDDPDLAHRQRSIFGQERLATFLAAEGLEFTDLESYAAATQELQSRFCVLALEHALSLWPRCQGLLLWQLNEPWAAPTWSLIDHAGRPKPALEALQGVFERWLAQNSH